ncbi:MAG: glycosyltransferase family 9 protein [Candidatus Krumholzibacteria bacterium]|nr:glycosyltransferase family 9 protein [Candidatus Krumholzibacteria bacterium]
MRVLIIRFSSLGDCVLLCPLAAALKRSGVEEVAVVTKRAYAGLFACATGVDRVVAFEPRASAAGLMRLARAWRGRGHMVLDAHNTWRSRLLAARLGGAHARFAKHYAERLGLIVLKRPAEVPTMLERYGALAATVGVEASLAPGGLTLPVRARTEAAGRLAGGDSFIAIAPGARWPSKRWPAERFRALVVRLAHEHGLRVLLLGDGRDRGAASGIAEALDERCVDVTGRASIVESAALLERCVGFVGNDSGLMHLAEAVGVPVTALFGPTVSTFGYFPSLERSKSVERDLPCRPCSRNGAAPCPRGTRECIEGIPEATVYGAVADMLAGRGPRRYVAP